MRTLRLLFFLSAVFLICASLGIAALEPLQSGKAADHNQKGLQYYKEGFYQHLPNGRQGEANRAFDLAVAEFRAAIAEAPQSAQAHRNLARVYYVRKAYLQAAEAYRTVTMLEPQDLDTYMLLALCYTQSNRFAEALQALETGKTMTRDPEIIGKFEAAIKKINDHSQAPQEGEGRNE